VEPIHVYRVEYVVDGDADGDAGGCEVVADGPGLAVVTMTGEQSLLDAVLVRLVAGDRRPPACRAQLAHNTLYVIATSTVHFSLHHCISLYYKSTTLLITP